MKRIRLASNKKHSWLVVLLFLLAAIQVFASAEPAFGKSGARDGVADLAATAWVPDLQSLHCPWFYVGEDFNSFIALKNTTETELNVYLSIEFGANESEDGSFDQGEPIKLAAGEARYLSLRQLRDQHKSLFKNAVSGGLELLFFGNPADLIAKTSVVSAQRH